jgi:NAD(P)-dependent dehydrogenase (short-subunit alcohol dehydrogenase family)
MFGNNPQFTTADIPDQSGRVILVTGGNGGLGKATILALARQNAKLYMASRTESKALAAIDDIKSAVPTADVTFLPLDLASFASIAECARSFLEKEARLHCLINNAGVMAMPYSETKDGYEIQFGTNHMGHYLLTRQLLPALEKAAEQSPAGSVRIVNLSSLAHNYAFSGLQIEDLPNSLKRVTRYELYGITKLANLLHARELAKRYPKILSVSAHPGIIMSDLYNPFVGENLVFKACFSAMKLVCTGADDGALNQLFCAVGDVKMEDNGEYFVPVGKKAEDAWWLMRPTKQARNGELATRLWEWSEEEVKKHGY